jgi:hypothetical protein
MQGVFACPECGSEVEPGDLTPGRQVRCGECRTLVEVPFLPRGQSIRRYRTSRRSRRPLWIAAGSGGLVLGMIAGLLLTSWAGRRSEHRREIRAALSEADRATASGDPAAAFNALETALRLCRTRRIDPPGGLNGLIDRRDAASRAEASARLDRLAAAPLNPDAALGESLTLWQRCASDPALADLAPRADAAARTARDRWLAGHLAEGRALLAQDLAADALALAGRLARSAREMPPAFDTEIRPEIDAFAREIVALAGAVADLRIDCGWDLPDLPPHKPDDIPRLHRALESRGYLLPPADSPFRPLWDTAPYRLTLEIHEGPGVRYLQSPHRVTQIEAVLQLDRRDASPWLAGIQARTRVPVQGLGALEASRLGLGSHPDPEVERRLYADARADFAAKLDRELSRLPERPRRAIPSAP